MTWDASRRVFDYRAGPPGPSREEKELLATWMLEQAGPSLPYGFLVERYQGLKGERISGFSMSELIRQRDRMVVACVNVTRTEEVMIPIVAAMTGIRMASFADRRAAERWLAGTLTPCTSPTATP